MRKAAGIITIVLGMIMVGTFIGALSEGGIHQYGLDFILFISISVVFIIVGGVFCLKRKYWKLCFASSLLLILAVIWSLFTLPMTLTWFLLLGVLPIIFVCLGRKEWQEF